jgi:hypothetical protein
MFDEIFADDVYDLNAAPRWVVAQTGSGFKVIDTLWQNELKAEYSDRSEAEEVATILNRYEGTNDR